MRRILDIRGVLGTDELPQEYLTGHPRIWWTRDNKALNTGCTSVHDLWIGKDCTEEEFQDVLRYIREAGERLHQINKKIKEIEKTWRGEETIIV